MTDVRKTALYECHKEAGGRLVSFAGWHLPISFKGVLAEHHAVRKNCGIFDVSHMGELRVEGKQAGRFLQWALCNNIEKISVGQGQYTAMLNEAGGFIDDLIVYRLGDNDYLLCVNAANISKDFAWLQKISSDYDVQLSNQSDQWSQLAVQGPRSKDALLAALPALADSPFLQLAYMNIFACEHDGQQMLIARTGYTGEHGYELYLPNAIAADVWKRILTCDVGVEPCGLGSRDTLRLEACYLLYGNDMNEEVNPLEAGIRWAVKLNGANFLGKEALLKQADSLERKIYCFAMADDGIARQGMVIYKDDQAIGKVTSASVLPTVGGAGGMALLNNTELKPDDSIEVEIRGKRKLAKIVKRPLYMAKVS